MREPFEYDEQSGLLWLTGWTESNPRIRAGFSTRLNGVGVGPYGSLNVGLHVGDDPAVVAENRRRLAEAAGFPFESWTNAEQVHGNRVSVVGTSDKGKGRLEMTDAISGCDAIATNEPNVLLTSFYADCVPLFFYDPEHEAVALAHAGWKGTALKIAEETVRTMEHRYGSKPERLLAAIGPSIGGCCYEVDERVTLAMKAALGIEPDDKVEGIEEKSGNKSMLDLKEINRQIMIKAGILPIHIESTQLCTSCRLDWFFSHRAEHGRTGRMASFIGMQEEVNDGS